MTTFTNNNGELNFLMEEVRKHNVLTIEQQTETIRRWKEYGDKKALNILITSNLRYVVKIVNTYKGYIDGIRITKLDLVQVGTEGIIRAAKKFDASRKVRFISYASYWIHAYVKKFIIDNSSAFKFATTDYFRKAFFKRKSISYVKNMNEDEANKERERIRKRLNMGEKKFQYVEKVFSVVYNVTSIDTDYDKRNGKARSYHNIISYDEDNIDKKCEDKELTEKSKNAIESLLKRVLDKRELDVVNRHVLQDKTLEHISKDYNISREGTRLIAIKAIRKLKAKLELADNAKTLQLLKDAHANV